MAPEFEKGVVRNDSVLTGSRGQDLNSSSSSRLGSRAEKATCHCAHHLAMSALADDERVAA